MATRFPLGVRIRDQHYTKAVTGLRWKTTAPGGYHSASMTVNLDPGVLASLSASDPIRIYGPTGRVVFEGFIDSPGRFTERGGSGYELLAMGTVVLASDRAEPLIYADRSFDGFVPHPQGINYSTAGNTVDPNGTVAGDGLIAQFNRQAIAQGSAAQLGYNTIRDAGWQVASIYAQVKSGKSDTGYRCDVIYSGPNGVAGSIAPFGFNTTLTAGWARIGGSPPLPPGTNAVALRLIRTGTATSVADDNTWSWWTGVVVLGRRMDRNGTLLTDLTGPLGMQSLTHVRADWVAEDLLGRLLAVCDKASSIIDPATFLIDQLTYPDGATAADVLDDLLVYEPDFLWEMLQSTASGYVFNFRKWPTTVRYEVSTKDGYDAPGAEFDLCNRVLVKWVDSRGKPQTTIVTSASTLGAIVAGVAATVASPSLKALEDVGRIRDAETITLPEGRGSAANATRAGQQLLALKADPPKAATVVVKRPIVDLLRGGTAMPYEIEPGYLVRVRETGDVLRLTEVEVDDEAGTATLTLGEPIPTEEQRLARLENVARRRAA